LLVFFLFLRVIYVIFDFHFWRMKLVSLVGTFSTAAAYTYDLTIDLCDPSGCHPSQQRVALDANAKPGHENQVHVDGNSLTLEYAQWIGGPRVYLIEQWNANKMFHIEGNEFSFDVELSSMTCGFNAAAYLVGMDANPGGAEWGTKYCDAQAVTDGSEVGTYCSEMDLFEGNTAAQQMTTHGCIDKCASFSDDWGCKSQGKNDICDHSGCGMNPFRYGPGSGYGGDAGYNEHWYGAGSQYQLDSTKPFTVTTQFHGDRMERFYTQNGQHIALPTLYVRKPTEGSHFDPFYNPHINEEYCALTFDKWTGDGLGPHDQMMKNSRNGMVLAMSAWYDEEVGPDRGMSWMDGSNGWGKVGPCNTYPTSDQGYHKATFSNIRFGSIGHTVAPAPPAPTPPPPPPPPPAPHCCQGGCGGYCQQGWCGQSASNCAQCSGQFCPGVLV